MSSVYDTYVNHAMMLAKQGKVSTTDRPELINILTPINLLFEALKQKKLISEVVVTDIQSGVACSAKVDEDCWIIAQCCLPITNNRALIRWGTATKAGTIEKPVGEQHFSKAVPGNEHFSHDKVLLALATLVGEASNNKLASQISPL
jgi:hypothetical protein